jgi:hypothetical protein
VHAVIPIILSEADPEAKLKALKKDSSFKRRKSPAAAKDADAKASKGANKWQLKVHNLDEWASWLFLQKVERNLKAENFFIQARFHHVAAITMISVGGPVMQCSPGHLAKT